MSCYILGDYALELKANSVPHNKTMLFNQVGNFSLILTKTLLSNRIRLIKKDIAIVYEENLSLRILHLQKDITWLKMFFKR